MPFRPDRRLLLSDRGSVPRGGRADPDPAEVARALRDGEIGAEFQPRVDLATGRFTAVEALARWRGRRSVGPLLFLPALADLGLRGALAWRVFEVACDALDSWGAAGLAPRVTINICSRALADAGTIAGLRERAQARGVEPGRFTFEPVDGADPTPAVAEGLTALRHHGFRLATSLSQLGKFHFSQLRIDQSLVRNCDQSGRVLSLVHAAVELARRLNADTVAEGIETLGEWNVLAGAGCNQAQGFLIAPTMEAAALPDWHEHWRASFVGGTPVGPLPGAPGPNLFR